MLCMFVTEGWIFIKENQTFFLNYAYFKTCQNCFITIKIPVISLLWYWLSCKYYINLFKIKMKFILKITFFKPMFLRKRCFRLNVFSLINNVFILKKNKIRVVSKGRKILCCPFSVIVIKIEKLSDAL